MHKRDEALMVHTEHVSDVFEFGNMWAAFFDKRWLVESLELKLIKLMKRKLKIKPNKIFSDIYSTVDTRRHLALYFVIRWIL